MTAALNEAVRAVTDPSNFVVGRSASDIKRLLDGSVDQALGTAIRGFFEPDVPAADVEAAALLYADAHAIAACYNGQLPESDEDGEVEEARLRALGRSEQHIRIVGDKPTAAYTQRDLSIFVKALWRIPRSFRVQSIWLRPWSDVESSLPSKPASNEKRSPKTLNKDLAYLSTAFDHLPKLGHYVADEVKPLALSATVSAAAKSSGRVPWKAAHLSTMLAAPVWIGNAGSKRRFESGDQVFHDGAYWMLLLAIYVLARQNEIAGLGIADFVFDHQIPHVIIRENDLRGLKSASSCRWVPLHPRLLALGLEAYVKAIAAEGHAVVFPELWRNGTKVGGDQYRATVWNKLMAWTSRQPGFATPRTPVGKAADFHSVRATGLSQLDRKGINQNIVKDIAGHAREGVTAQSYQKLLESGGLAEVLAERLAVLMELPDVAAHLQFYPVRLLPLNLRSR